MKRNILTLWEFFKLIPKIIFLWNQHYVMKHFHSDETEYIDRKIIQSVSLSNWFYFLALSSDLILISLNFKGDNGNKTVGICGFHGVLRHTHIQSSEQPHHRHRWSNRYLPWPGSLQGKRTMREMYMKGKKALHLSHFSLCPERYWLTRFWVTFTCFIGLFFFFNFPWAVLTVNTIFYLNYTITRHGPNEW